MLLRFSSFALSETPKADIVPPPQKEKEELDDVSNELELADEDETVPYATSPDGPDRAN